MTSYWSGPPPPDANTNYIISLVGFLKTTSAPGFGLCWASAEYSNFCIMHLTVAFCLDCSHGDKVTCQNDLHAVWTQLHHHRQTRTCESSKEMDVRWSACKWTPAHRTWNTIRHIRRPCTYNVNYNEGNNILFSRRGCDLTLLKPLWQLFTSMEGGQDPTSITVLLPLHRALTELFFIAEAKAMVSDRSSNIQH